MIIAPYSPEDFSPTLSLLQANIPKYFAPEEYDDLATYLQQEREDYFTGTLNGQLVAAGGINYLPDSRSARISWDIVHPDFHGRGLGRQLLQHRLDLLRRNPQITSVSVRTSQHTHGFYAKAGFLLQYQEKDYWFKGFDLYHMELVFH
ncbi:GNAT family N-acetyltransferase [Lewinella sp. W8]|uniref:GNAT family N-acetyltransferase n=1 Tax=Lewinella sp. W8 TaxID=2528208 RepID=UPI00106753E9|nr:GNAT family N-acetyltransferase [Lewinella sp. W8]MTB51589.1 GNAT family N-acetyltransferase [Lewinella sp. W8]